MAIVARTMGRRRVVIVESVFCRYDLIDFDFVDEEPRLLACADVPFGQAAVVGCFDADKACRGGGAIDDEVVDGAEFLPLEGGGEFAVVDAAEGLPAGVVGRHFDLDS